MDEARAVLARLDRIEALDRAGAAPRELLGELRSLVAEAERWARREDDRGALELAAQCRDALEEADPETAALSANANPTPTTRC